MNREIEFFKKISDYFWKLTKKDGSLVCPKHRVEHTGKNVYSVTIDLKLHKLTGEEDYFRRAKLRVERTLEKLIRDPDFRYWIFYPGRLGRWNMSNSVIDSGACIDALSTFYLDYHNRLTGEERRRIEDTIFKNSDSYLNEAVVSKEITNQRLWGGTGLSRAYKIFGEERWRKSLIRSLEKSLGEMWPDGTFPYHSYWKEYKIFKGIYDTTTFYHSRCIAFIYYILENIQEPLDKYKENLIKATDLLIAMYQSNGLKDINLECKRWYWNSSYEVASNPFDIFALAKGYELTKNENYAYYANKSLGQILNHQFPDGGINSHLGEPQNNFQCRIFWNSNLAWLAKIIEELPSVGTEKEIKEFQHFENSDILKFRNENYSCILRAKKQPINLMWGPAVGGGSLLYFGTKKNNWENLIKIKPWEENAPANFTFYTKENYLKNLKDFLTENKKEIRSKLYHVLVELRTPNFKSFLAFLLNIFKMCVLAGRGTYASHWATNAVSHRAGDRITFEIIPTKRNGGELSGVKIKRDYIFGDNELSIKENLFLESNRIKRIKYNKFPDSANFKIVTDLKYRESHQSVLCHVTKPKSHLEISYLLKNFNYGA